MTSTKPQSRRPEPARRIVWQLSGELAPPETPVEIAPIPVECMLTTRQAAAILNVSEQTLKKWRQRNMEPEFIRYHGEAVRYRLTTILKFLVDSTVKL